MLPGVRSDRTLRPLHQTIIGLNGVMFAVTLQADLHAIARSSDPDLYATHHIPISSEIVETTIQAARVLRRP
jgi:hypothetical protein